MPDEVLKMNRKKRKTSGGRATNLNQKQSTVNPNDAVEVREMVTTDPDGTSVVDLGEGGEELDYVEVAWLLREKLTDFVEGGNGGPPELELRSVLDLVASRKIVSVDSKKMSPVLWSTLPKELLALVLARLPLPDIARLRCLSKGFNRYLVTVNSDINRALDEASPTMVAGFSFTNFYSNSEYIVTICDLSNHRSSYTYRLHPGKSSRGRWDDMGARDGGLVCLVSTRESSKAKPLCILVVNLLTRVQRKLPPLQYVYLSPPKMMNIEVDPETKRYRVVVIGKNRNGRATVEIYHSGTRQWTKVQPPLGLIFGVAYSRWKYYFHDRTFRSTSLTRSVYDFADGKVKRCDERGPSRGASVVTFAHYQDCMFVLHRKTTSNGEILQGEGHCVTKYRIHNNLKDWVQEKSYVCSPLEDYLELDDGFMSLKPCDGGFLVASRYPSDHFWLLDLPTGEWSIVPNCFQGHKYGAFLSRAFWNVAP